MFFVGVTVATLHVHILGVNVASVHFLVYVRGCQCCLCSCPCLCVREGGRLVIVASVHLHVYMLGEGQCCLCSCSCVGGINVGSVHVHMLGESMLPVCTSMC